MFWAIYKMKLEKNKGFIVESWLITIVFHRKCGCKDFISHIWNINNTHAKKLFFTKDFIGLTRVIWWHGGSERDLSQWNCKVAMLKLDRELNKPNLEECVIKPNELLISYLELHSSWELFNISHMTLTQGCSLL